jgi:hypothetical protein
MGRYLLGKRSAYRRKRTNQGRQKKRKYRKNNIATCARSSCCFPASTTSESCEANTEQSAPSQSSLNTCSNTEAECVVNQVYTPEKNSVAHKKKVLHTTPSKKKSNKTFGSCDYFNDPLYIRFQEYKLLRKRTQEIESQTLWYDILL